MGRPKKYHSEEDRLISARVSADVVREIREKSGLSYPKISEEFEKHKIILSAGMLRQYACGKKIIGSRLLTEMAGIAISQDWAGEKCYEVFSLHNYDHIKNLNDMNKKSQHFLELSQKRLAVSVSELAEAGVSLNNIIKIVAKEYQFAYEKLFFS